MTYLTQQAETSGRQFSAKRIALVWLMTTLVGMLSACSTSVHIPTAAAGGPQLYMSGNGLATYSINDSALQFWEESYDPSGVVSNAGQIAVLSRGMLELNLTCSTPTGSPAACTAVSSSQTGSGWAVEMADQDGGLLQLAGQPFVPLVPAVTCPSAKSAETFQFVTIPNALSTSGTIEYDSWNPQLETAYGSVDVSATGSTVNLANITQDILGGGTSATAPSSGVTGVCSATVYGNTVALAANPIAITTAGNTGTDFGPQSTIGIGPSGLLVEANSTIETTAPFYENALGAGIGAIGLPKPSSAVSVSSLVGAQYLGFFYGGGSSTSQSSSSAASFGFPALPSGCPAVSPQASSVIYGGDFPDNNPAAPAVQSAGGFGNCDFAIDLGAQDPSNNGLFPAATIYVGSGFAANATGSAYHFPAVAIAGQLNGKYAIFVIGEDTTGSPNQAWGIYLLQSN